MSLVNNVGNMLSWFMQFMGVGLGLNVFTDSLKGGDWIYENNPLRRFC